LKSRGLRIGKNVKLTGNFKFGQKVYISDNVKMYSNIVIGNNTYVDDNVELRCHKSVEIRIGENCTINRCSIIIGKVNVGDDVLIAPGCAIMGANHIISEKNELIRKQGMERKGVVIENNVWIGANVSILDGLTVGEGSVIGAGSVVTKSIPKFSIAVGNPSKVVKQRN
jgi:acetyltransferase-like isoleucine patch superfamily enzyme